MSWIDDLIASQDQGGGTAGPPAPAEDPSLLRTLAHAALTPLQWLGETLDKPGRALRGLLAGKPEELLNLIPLSDTLGITDPTKAVRGRDLLRQWGAIDQEDTWGNFFGGLGTEILLDPTNLVTLGATSSLSAAGRAAAQSGKLLPTAAARIGAGQAGMMGLRTPWWTELMGLPAGRAPLLTGDAGLGIAKGLEKLGDKAIDLPLGGQIASALMYGRGHTGDPRFVKAAGGTERAEQQFVSALAPEYTALLRPQSQAINDLTGMGVNRAAVEDAFKSQFDIAKDLAPQRSPVFWDLPAAQRGPAASQLTELAQAAADAAPAFYDKARATAQGLGIKISDTPLHWLGEYAHERAWDSTRSMYSQQTARSLPHEVLPFGETQLKDLASDVRTDMSRTGIAGLARDLESQQALVGQVKDPANYKPMGIDVAEELWRKKFTRANPGAVPPASYASLVDRLGRGLDLQKKSEEDLVRFVGKMKDELHPVDKLLIKKANQATPGNVDPRLINHAVETWAQGHASDVIAKRDALLAEHAPGLLEARKAGQDVALEGVDPKLMPLINLTDEQIVNKSRELGRYVSEVDPALARAGRGVRRPDPAGNAYEYLTNTARQAGRAEGIHETLAREAKPLAEALGQSGDRGTIRTLRQALDEVGLNAIVKDGRTTELGGKMELLRRLVDKGKSTLSGETQTAKIAQELDKFAVPQDLIKTLTEELAGPKLAKPFGLGEKVDKLLSTFRSWVTVPFAPYHLRNFADALTQQGLGGGFSLKAMGDVKDYMAGAIKNPALEKELGKYAEEAFVHGAGFQHQPLELLGKGVTQQGARALAPFPAQTGDSVSKAIGGFFQKFKSGEGQTYLTLDPARNTLVQRGIDVHLATDQFNRFSQFVGLRRQGYSAEAAAQIVKDSQLQYSRLTPFEQNVARRFMPFYAFSAANIARTGRQLQNPGPLASLIRTANEARNDSTIPAWAAPGMALPAGTTDDGKQRFLSGFGLAVEDELLGSLIAGVSGRPGEAARRAGSALDPLSKLAIELGTDTQLYSGRKLSETSPSPLLSFLPAGVGRAVTEGVSATPMSRIFSTLDKAGGVTTGDRPALETITNLLTGIRTSAVDLPQAQNQAARKALDDLLTATGQVAHRTDTYVKPDQKGKESPEVLALMKLMSELEKSASQRRKLQALQQQ